MQNSFSCAVVIYVNLHIQGIGEASAIRFANHNPEYKVWATMRNIDDWKTDNHFGNLKLASLDVTSEESVQHAIDHIIAIEGKIDVIINNAGYGIAGTLETVTLKEAKVRQKMITIAFVTAWNYVLCIWLLRLCLK
jgi:NADP-dependent 3-hydroxy acid dehydrogenase YdfG